ncbi:MAG: DNA topoisomerase IV subunit A [Desulfurivibrionaceae bacterium]|nr:DNA topoisomerase IV subunit A [Desulfurivibrionaceae bacterium]
MHHLEDYGGLHQLFDRNFLDYTSYVIKERAIPDVSDGLKPVQRRIMQTLNNMDDGRFNKVANVVGDCMKLHPHGDQSIYAALVNLANKGYLLDRQGNFGNIYTGDGASAARYIECRLSPLARETLFNKDLTVFTDSYDGRMLEPISLPSKIPLLLLQGAEGIAVGMATKIMPHNFVEVLEAQKNILRDKEIQLFPDFQQGGMLDVSGYEDGNGRLKCRACIQEKDEKTIIITEIPYSTTTLSIMESVEKAAKQGKIKIHSINDYTAEEVEIEIKLPRGIYAEDTIRALYAFTDCEVPLSPNLTVIRNDNPVNISVSEVLQDNTYKLVSDLEKELLIDLDRLQERLQASLLEQIFIEERLYKKIEECDSYQLVVETVDASLKPFRDRLLRDVTFEDIERLLEIRIKRISRYDIAKKQKEINVTLKKIKAVKKHLEDMVLYTINYIDGLLKKYGPDYARRTQLATFSEVEARQVALSNLTVGYQEESGFLGHQVKGDQGFSFPCSEYDKIMLIFKNGSYKIVPVADKVFIGRDLLWMGKVEGDLVFNIIYKNGVENLSYIKRFKMPKFITDKEYELFPPHKRSLIQFISLGEEGLVRIYYTPSKRAKANYEDLPLGDFLLKGAAARGKRVSSTRPVTRVRALASKEEGADEVKKPAPLFTTKK